MPSSARGGVFAKLFAPFYDWAVELRARSLLTKLGTLTTHRRVRAETPSHSQEISGSLDVDFSAVEPSDLQ